MIYLLDTADLKAIKYCKEFYPLSGVTTNPSIIAKEKGDFWRVLRDIRTVIGNEKMLHVQTMQVKAEKMAEEANLIKEKIGGNLYIKIPICEEGLKAVSMVKEIGVGVTMTAIFTPAQALMAARAGADFVAPYVNRLDNILGDGTNAVAEIVRQFGIYNLDCKVLAASFKNAEQVHKCALFGCHSVTVSEEVLKSLIAHPMTEAAISGFKSDWKTVYGDNMILDL